MSKAHRPPPEIRKIMSKKGSWSDEEWDILQDYSSKQPRRFGLVGQAVEATKDAEKYKELVAFYPGRDWLKWPHYVTKFGLIERK